MQDRYFRIAAVIVSVFFTFGPWSPIGRAAFNPGDVLYTNVNSVFKIGGGGDFSKRSPDLLIPSYSLGQLAFDQDLSAAYTTQFNNDTIVRVTPDGAATTFASGVRAPTGILRLRDGRLLAASFGGKIYDITTGGSFTSAQPFATGLHSARNMLQTADGRILVADESGGAVMDITAGGNFSAAKPFASGLDAIADLIQDTSGRIFVAEFNRMRVVDITTGGDLTTAPAFATGAPFFSLAVDARGRLLASMMGGGTSGSVYDITAGGSFARATPFASGLPTGETNVDMVPVPEPSMLGVSFSLAFVRLALGRRRRLSREPSSSKGS